MGPTTHLHDLDPLVATLDAVAASGRAICPLPARAWSDWGPVQWPGPLAPEGRCCAFCGILITAFYRRGPDGRVIHCDRKECLAMIKTIALFALDTCIDSEPEVDLAHIPF